jgi:hypothetical protein
VDRRGLLVSKGQMWCACVKQVLTAIQHALRDVHLRREAGAAGKQQFSLDFGETRAKILRVCLHKSSTAGISAPGLALFNALERGALSRFARSLQQPNPYVLF